MAVFYFFDVYLGNKEVYTRPSHAMVVSSVVPFILAVCTMVLPAWQSPALNVWLIGVLSGAVLIWANWFYFLIMFPEKGNHDAEIAEGSTELALYEGATPVIVLLLAVVASSFIIYDDTVSSLQAVGVILTVLGLILFANAEGFKGISRWSYRIKLILFAVLAAFSQLIQDILIDYVQTSGGLTTVETYLSVSPAIWLGMASGIVIIFWKREGYEFKKQWPVMKKYVPLIFLAELIALASYASLIVAYSGEHVATAQAIGSSFPVLVFLGVIFLPFLRGEDENPTSHIGKKIACIFITLIGVAGVILF
jgi:hypothetical protein